MDRTGTMDAPAETPRLRLRGLMLRLVRLGFALGRAAGDYARGLLAAGPADTADARAGFDLGGVLFLLQRGVGWASALRARLQAEDLAAALHRGEALAVSVPVNAAPRRDRGGRARDSAAPWRADGDEQWAAAIAGKPVSEVATQICRDLAIGAALLGDARLARAVERVVQALAELLGAVEASVLERPPELARLAAVPVAEIDVDEAGLLRPG